MEDFFWIVLVVVVVGSVIVAALWLGGLAGTVAATCVFGAAAHAFFATMWRGVLHRGGASAAQGPDEPAFRAYYRSQVWRDLKTAAAAAWQSARDETARIQALASRGTSRYLAVLRVILKIYAYIGLALGAMLGVMAGILPALLLALVAGGAWAIAAPLQGLERMRRTRRGTHFDCPECHDRFALPVYVCPNCSAKHRQLAPGPFGVLRHRCTCGARLPALQPLGRERLTSECPAHGHVLGEGVGVVRTLHVPVAGGPSTGKSTFLAAAMLGLEEAVAAGTLSTAVQSSSRDGYGRLLDGFRRGILPTKTVDLQAPALVAEIRGKDKSALLYAYDVAGEAYGDEHELRRDPGYGLAEGVVLLVDPFALERVRSDLGEELAAEPELRPSPEAPQRVLERLVGVLDEKGIDLGRVPAAICITKCDALGIGDAIDRSPGADPDARVRAWLEAQGAGNLLRSAEGTFKEIRCFSASALGRTPGAGSGPFVASGTLEPLLWLLATAGVQPAMAGLAQVTQTQRITVAEPLDVVPRRPLFSGAIDAIKPWPLAANFALGLIVFVALLYASTPLALVSSNGSERDFGGSASVSKGDSDASPDGSRADIAETATVPDAERDDAKPSAAEPSDPPPAADADGGETADEHPTARAGGSPNSPSRVLRRHFQRLSSGDYDGAFELMSRRYRQANPRWTLQPRRARPALDIARIGPSRVGSRVAFVTVRFYARDRNDTALSDTRCRRFAGRALLVKEGSRWRYNPRDNQYEPTLLPSSLQVCKSLIRTR